MNLQNWISQAREHWKEHQPKRFQELKSKNQLGNALREAAERTHAEMSELEASGMTTHEAWEMTREQYLFPPAESSQDDEQPASGSLFNEAMAVMQPEDEQADQTEPTQAA